MEELSRSGAARLLGISNVNRGQLEFLLRHASIAPTFVQNRCYASRGWDREVRRICEANSIIYQGFSLLTANREVLAGALVQGIAAQHRCQPTQVIFRFALGVGMLVAALLPRKFVGKAARRALGAATVAAELGLAYGKQARNAAGEAAHDGLEKFGEGIEKIGETTAPLRQRAVSAGHDARKTGSRLATEALKFATRRLHR